MVDELHREAKGKKGESNHDDGKVSNIPDLGESSTMEAKADTDRVVTHTQRKCVTTATRQAM